MRIAITGHTRGIGLSIFKKLTDEGHDVYGFSKSCGQDIVNTAFLIELIKSCDVFINNAHYSFYQVILLQQLFELWKDTPKLIINIGSNSPDCSPAFDNLYSTEKSALDHASMRLSKSNSLCRVTNIRLGYVDTSRVSHIKNKPKIDPNNVAEIISWVISQPSSLLIRDMTIEPK